MQFANKAAGSVIGVKGTEPLSNQFLNTYIKTSLNKKKIGFTNGCFDILHLGHINLLKKAKESCDYLIVGLNSDSSVKKLKGNKRPINDQFTRLEILKSFRFIDEVIIFDEDTPMRLIKEISPHVLLKGADYREDQIIGAEYVKSYGGEVKIIKLVSGKSTSLTLDKIKNIYQDNQL